MANNFAQSYGITKKQSSDITDKKKPIIKPTQKQSGFSLVPQVSADEGIQYNDIDMQNIQTLKKMGIPQDKIMDLVRKKKEIREASISGSIKKTGEGFISGSIKKTGEAFMGGIKRIGEAGVGLAEGKYTAPEAFARGGAGALQSFTSPIAGVVGQTLETGIKQIPQGFKDYIATKAKPTIQDVTTWYNTQTPEQKRQLQNIGVGVEILSNFVGAKGVQLGAKQVGIDSTLNIPTVIQQTAKKFKQAYKGVEQRLTTGPLQSKGVVGQEPVISQVKSIKFGNDVQKSDDLIRRGLKPKKDTKMTGEQYNMQNNKIRQGIKEVAQSEGIADDGLDALNKVSKAKKKIYEQVKKNNELVTKQTNIDDISDELRQYFTTDSGKAFIAKNPQVKKTLDDTIANWKEVYGGSISQNDLQILKQEYNKTLAKSDFAKMLQGDNPKYLSDALLSRTLGSKIDDNIMDILGKTNKELNSKYGAIRELEKNLVGRIQIFSRNSKSGLGGLLDSFNLGDIVMGMLTGDVKQAGTGLIRKAVLSTIKRNENPNYIINKLFKLHGPKKGEKIFTGIPKETTPPIKSPLLLPQGKTPASENVRTFVTESKTPIKVPTGTVGKAPVEPKGKVTPPIKTTEKQNLVIKKPEATSQIEKNKIISEGYKKSAEKRFAEGDFTTTEIQKGRTKLESLYEGRQIEFDGKKGVIVGKPAYGKVKIKIGDKIQSYDTGLVSQTQKKPSLGEIKEYLKGTEYKGYGLTPKTFLQKTKDKAEDIVDTIAEKVGGRSNFMSANKGGPTNLTKADLEDFTTYIDNYQKDIQGIKRPNNVTNKQTKQAIIQGNKNINSNYIDNLKRQKIKSIGEKLTEFVKKNILPSDFNSKAQEVIDKIAKFTGTKSNIVNEGDNLFHGTKAKFDIFDDNKAVANGFLGKGHYFTPNKDYAKTYGRNIKETILNKGLKIYNSKAESSGQVFSELKSKFPGLDETNITQVLEKNGYNGIQYTDWDRGDIINIFKSKDIPTKSPILKPKIIETLGSRNPIKSYSNKRASIGGGESDLVSTIPTAQEAVGEIVYRGGVSEGASFSTQKQIAEDFAKYRGGSVNKYIIDKKANIAEYSDFPQKEYKNTDNFEMWLDKKPDKLSFMENELELEFKKATNWAKNNGYDGIRLPVEDEVRIINKNIIKRIPKPTNTKPLIKKPKKL